MAGNGKAAEQGTQRRVKEALEPLRRQGENFLGCFGALMIIALMVALLNWLGLREWVLGITATVLGLGMLGGWSTWDDKQKRKATDICVDRFEQAFPEGDPARPQAIEILRSMGAQEKHSYNKAANQLLVELGEGGLPDKPAEEALGNALAKLDGEPATNPEPPPPTPPGLTGEPPAPTPPPAAEGHNGIRRQPRVIPLEPEEYS